MIEWGEQLGLFGNEGFPEPPQDKIAAIESLAISITRSYGLKVSVVKWKDNKRVMASVGKGGVLNLHNIYKRAEESDLKILAKVMTGKASSRENSNFQKYIENHLPRELGKGKSRLVIMPAQGLFHDLNKALERLLPLVGGKLEPMPMVGWTAARVGRSGITWGTHRITPDGPLILINSVLDAPDIPNFVLEHIIWHEMCHQLAPPEENGDGRRSVHTREFKKFEAMYPRLEQAEKWERDHVGRCVKKYM